MQITFKKVREIEKLVVSLMSWENYCYEPTQSNRLQYDLAFHSKVLYYLQVGKNVLKAKIKELEDRHEKIMKTIENEN
jgi:hypothetical protein